MLAVISLNASLTAVRNPGPHSVKKAASQKSQAIHSTYLTGVFLGILINFFFFSPEYKQLSVQLKVPIYCKDHPLSPSPTQHCSFEMVTLRTEAICFMNHFDQESIHLASSV